MNHSFPVLDMYGTGQRIKGIMKDKGFSVKDIQNYLGLNAQQSIYHWFYGKSIPSVDNLYALSALFRVPIDDMLVGNRTQFQNSLNEPLFEALLLRIKAYQSRLLYNR